MTRAAALVPTAVLVVTGLVGGLSPSVQAAPVGAAADTGATYSVTAHAATNKARTRQGLKPLGASSCLQAYADRQAALMAAAGELSHQDLGPVMAGCSMSAAGENVALGFTSGKAAVRGWMASPGHRANILAKRYRWEAISAVVGPDGTWYAAQVFGR